MKIVRIQRGIQGSGKSTRANAALSIAKAEDKTTALCSADNFFTTDGGKYAFSFNLLADAHKYCLETFVDAIFNGFDFIVVDNTNIKFSEFQLYIKIAKAAGYKVVVEEIKPKDDLELESWAKRNVHKVPVESVKKRWKQWEEIPKMFRNIVEVI